ncbi:MAG: acyltransferase, partial [Leifsonia sp.]
MPASSSPDVPVTSRGPVTARLGGLDGLRGVAAAIVVIHHSLLLFPTMSSVYITGVAPAAGSMMWWMSYSPLKLLTAGGEAVIVFFVLSGLVLTLPVTRRPGFDWIAYFPRRFVRIWIPVVASVLIAYLLVLIVRQQPYQPGTTWLNLSSVLDPSWSKLVSATTLIGGDFQLNNPLWSLEWEMIFSVCLPLFVLGALAFRKWWIAGVAAAVLLAWVGVLGSIPALHFLPVFLAGAFLAVGLPGIESGAARLNRTAWGRWTWPPLLVVAALAMVAPWLIGPTLRDVDW